MTPPKPEDNAAGGGLVDSNKPKPSGPAMDSFAFDNILKLTWITGATSGNSKTYNGNDTYTVTGELKLATGAYTFPLSGAVVKVKLNAGLSVDTFSGTAKVSLPALHTFTGVTGPLVANFGYDLGANLGNLGLPLAADRKYIYFTFTAGFNSSFGTGPFSANTSQTITVVFDHRDPGFLFAGPMGPLSAVGLSEQSLIPYTASTTWGFDTPDMDFPTFSGQSYTEGEVSLEEIPVTVSGNVTTRFVGWDGRSALDKTKFQHTLGINGSFNLGWDFLDGTFHLEVPLSKASIYLTASANPYRSAVAVSGTAGTSTYLPSWLPVLLSDNSYLAGYIDTGDPSRNHLDGASETTIHSSTLGQAIGLKMNDLVLSQSSFHADRMGFRFEGQSSVGIIPELYTDSAKITACFGGDTMACLSDDQNGHPVTGSKDWLIRMESDTTIVGVPLVAATALAGPKGLTVSATYRTGVEDYLVSGSVTPGPHISVTGTANVTLPLTDLNQVVDEATAGAVCVAQKVTDIAKCGYSLTHFADEFHCGKPHCSWSWKHGLRCKGLSCDVKVPKTCDDVSKPKSCSLVGGTKFDSGAVSGTVALTIDNGGISGKLSGKFCPPGGGSCTSLSSAGTLDFSSVTHPKVCIKSTEIPVVGITVGRFCVRF